MCLRQQQPAGVLSHVLSDVVCVTLIIRDFFILSFFHSSFNSLLSRYIRYNIITRKNESETVPSLIEIHYGSLSKY